MRTADSMLQVLLIEDDPLGQIKLQIMLEEMGYFSALATSLDETVHYLSRKTPDLIVADVKLTDGSTIDFFEEMPPQCPVIFITAVPDRAWIDQTLAIPFAAFYVKPVHSLTLMAAIKRVRNDYLNHLSNHQNPKMLEIDVHYGYKIEVSLAEIFWIKVEGNYVSIHLKNRKYVQRSSLRKLKPELNEYFVQIHHAFIVNLDHITRVNLNENLVYIDGQSFNIGRTFRKKFIDSIYKRQV